jgi:hypothetical protein
VSGFAAGFTGRLPAWLAPRDEDARRRGLWRVETVVLVLVGIVLAVASFNDIFWSVDDNARLAADQTTWRHYTHRDYYTVSAAALVLGQPVDLACANASPGPPGERTQICLLLDGPVVHGLRTVIGGWRLPARAGDFPDERYDCFRAGATQTLCPKG